MERRNRTQLALGIILILIAAWLIATKIKPDLTSLINLPFAWPMWVIIAGGIVLLIGLLVGAPDMAIPACITAGIGAILYYQNATNRWDSWSFMWTLIPGFVGIGRLLAGILGREFKASLREGLNLVLISAILFTIFAAFFGGFMIFGKYSDYAPIALLFLFGIWLIVRGMIRRK